MADDNAQELERLAQAIAEQRRCSIELAREAARAMLAEQDDVIGLDEEPRKNPRSEV